MASTSSSSSSRSTEIDFLCFVPTVSSRQLATALLAHNPLTNSLIELRRCHQVLQECHLDTLFISPRWGVQPAIRLCRQLGVIDFAKFTDLYLTNVFRWQHQCERNTVGDPQVNCRSSDCDFLPRSIGARARYESLRIAARIQTLLLARFVYSPPATYSSFSFVGSLPTLVPLEEREQQVCMKAHAIWNQTRLAMCRVSEEQVDSLRKRGYEMPEKGFSMIPREEFLNLRKSLACLPSDYMTGLFSVEFALHIGCSNPLKTDHRISLLSCRTIRRLAGAEWGLAEQLPILNSLRYLPPTINCIVATFACYE